MPALTANANRKLTGGETDAVAKLQLSEVPFVGSALCYAADGFVEPIDATSLGQPFAGFCEQRVTAADHPSPAADGDIAIKIRKGLFFAALTISGAAQDDVAHGRLVYASTDNDFSFTPSGTLIGMVWERDSNGQIIVLCATQGHEGALFPRAKATKTLAATGTETLLTSDLGKLILVANTAGKQVNLPPAADCTGRGFLVKKTGGGAFSLTLDGDGAETIDGAATFAAVDANQDSVEIVSDGTGWHVVGGRIV